MQIQAARLTSGTGFLLSSTSNQLASSGKVGSIVANSATAGIGLDISTTGLQSGSALKVSTNALTTGKAIEIDGGAGLTTGALLSITSSVTGNSKASAGIVQLTATSLDEGKAIVVDVAGLTSGTGLEMTSNTALTTGHLLHLKTTSNQATKPVLITADAVTSGTIVHVDAAGLTTGNGLLLEGGTSTTMTSGALLKLQTSSTTPSAGVMQVIANAVTTGTVASISGTGVTSGTLLDISGGSNQNGGSLVSIGGLAGQKAFDVSAGDVGIAGYLEIGGGFHVTATAVTATGSNAGGAAAINILDSTVSVTTTTMNEGIKLPTAVLGKHIRFIRVNSNHPYILYPNSGGETIIGQSSFTVDRKSVV